MSNIIIGNIQFDLSGTIKALNDDSQDRVEITLKPGTKDCLEGYGYDENGTKIFKLLGSWRDQITLTNLVRRNTEIVWQRSEPLQNEKL